MTDIGSYGQFFVTTPTIGLYNYLGEYCLWISPSSADSGSPRSSSLFSGVFIVEADDGVGDKASANIATIDLQTLLEDFLNMPLRSAYLTDEAFFW